MSSSSDGDTARSRPTRVSVPSGRTSGSADWEYSASSEGGGEDSGSDVAPRPGQAAARALQLRRPRRKASRRGAPGAYQEFDVFVEERVPLSEELPPWCRSKVAKVMGGVLLLCLLAGAAAAGGLLPGLNDSLQSAAAWTLGRPTGPVGDAAFPEGVDPAGPPPPPPLSEDNEGVVKAENTGRRLAESAPSSPPDDASFFDPRTHVCGAGEWEGVVRGYLRHWGPGTITPRVLERVPPQGWGTRVQVLGGGREIRFQVHRSDPLWGDAVPRVLLGLREALRLWRKNRGGASSEEVAPAASAPYEPIPDVDMWVSGSPGPVEVPPPPLLSPSNGEGGTGSANLEDTLYPPVFTLQGSGTWDGVYGVPIPHPSLAWRVPADPRLEHGNSSLHPPALLAELARRCHPRRHPLARRNWEFAVSRGPSPLNRDSEVLRASDAGLESIVDVRAFFAGSRLLDSLASLCDHGVVVDTRGAPVRRPPPAPGSTVAQTGTAGAADSAVTSTPLLPWLLATGSVVARFSAPGHAASAAASGATDAAHGGLLSDWSQLHDFPELAPSYAAGARYDEVGEHYAPLLHAVTYRIGSPKAAKPLLNALLAHAVADRRGARAGPVVPFPAMAALASRARGFALQHFSPPGVLCYWRVLLHIYARELLAPGAVVPFADATAVDQAAAAHGSGSGSQSRRLARSKRRPTLSLLIDEPLHSNPDVELAMLHVAYACTGAAGLPDAAAACAAARASLQQLVPPAQ